MSEQTDRRRFTAGLCLGLLVGVVLLLLLEKEWRAGLRLMQQSRSGAVLVQSLAHTVTRALDAGSEVQPVIQAAIAGTPAIKSVRVIQGVRLEASTMPQDAGDRAAPRRLSRDEKYLYDRGQRLRASVLTNQEESTARKAEIEISELPQGGLSVAAPLEKDGAVIGYVEIETTPAPPVAAPNWLIAAAFVLVPSVVFFILAMPIGNKRILLAVSAFLLLAIGLAGCTMFVRRALVSDRLAQETAIASLIQSQKARVAQSTGVSVEEVTTGNWDVDIYRRSRGWLTEGTVNEAALNQQIAAQSSEFNKAVAGIAALAFLIAALVGFGVASKLWDTLKRHREAYAYTTPAMLGMLVLVFFPFAYGIALSFTDSNLYNSNQPITEVWIGLKNYVSILGDFSVIRKTDSGIMVDFSNFYWTLFFNIVWTVTNVAFGVIVGLILALILNTKGLAMRPLYRVLLIFPWAMPNYITALIWRGMFHQQFGVINQALQILGGSPISWFEKPTTSFLTALATNGWLSFPFMMVVSLGALQSIPADLYEAARVDGATRWQQFKSITLPSLRPALVPAIILSVVWTFNMFNIIFLVTAGEPGGATEILVTQAYKIAFQKYRYGYAAAYSTVIFIILLVYGTFQNRAAKATEAIS
jgi:arabinogalactan oligomer/maltooligosaccharide transport system permease protein